MQNTEELLARDYQVLKHRSQGRTNPWIAERLGLSVDQVRAAYKRAMARTGLEPARNMRVLDLMELSALQAAAWDVLNTDHYAHSGGRLIEVQDEYGQLSPVMDDGPKLAAIKTILWVQERRSKLVGLDAPAQSRVQVITESSVDEAIRLLNEEHERLEAELADHADESAGLGRD